MIVAAAVVVVVSATRFGEISTLWQHFVNLCECLANF